MSTAVLTNQKPQFSIHPTAAGKDSAVSELTDIVWTVNDANVASVVETAPDHSAVELRPVAAGTVTLIVTAKNKAGVALAEEAVVVFSDPVPVVDKLNLKYDGSVPA